MKRPSSALVIALALAAAAALGGCQRQGAGKAAAAQTAPTPYAAIAEGKADIEGGIINVAARSPGVVRAVYVQEGETVKKGQILTRQEDDAQRLAVQTAEAALAQAKAQMQLTEVQLATAQREFDRLQPLASSQFVARQQLDQARDAIRSAQATLIAQRAAVGVAQTEVDQARYNVELTVIRAPVDGKIVRRYAAPGAGASTLNVSTMFDLEPAGARIVRAEVSEAAEPNVAVGQAVQLVPEADQSKVYPGKVLRIAPVFGARKLQSDDPSARTDERVVETVVSADAAPFLIGQRVLVKFEKAGA